MNKDIFVVVEQRNGAIQKVSYELISEATKLAADLGEQVVAVLMGYNIADKADSLIHFGAQKVIVIDTPVLEHYTTEPYVLGIEHVIKKYEPNIVLFGAMTKALGMDDIDWEEVIAETVPEKFRELNLQAYRAGRNAAN